MSKIRVVLDSNVILSAALFKKSAPRQALDKALATGQILISPPSLAELEDIFNRSKFDKYLSKSARAEFLNDLIEILLIFILSPFLNISDRCQNIFYTFFPTSKWHVTHNCRLGS
jgi:predicted nucleic acid-binding protein